MVMSSLGVAAALVVAALAALATVTSTAKAAILVPPPPSPTLPSPTVPSPSTSRTTDAIISRSAFLTTTLTLTLTTTSIGSATASTGRAVQQRRNEHAVQSSSTASATATTATRGRGGGIDGEDVDEWQVAATRIRRRVREVLDESNNTNEGSAGNTMVGPLVRLAFHDAATYEKDDDGADGAATATGGPNGSIRYEIWDRNENRGLQRPLDVVTALWQEQEQEPQPNEGHALILSFADAIALCGSEAIRYAGGPHIPIQLGRVDSNHADPRLLRHPLKASTDRSLVDRTLPSAALDSDGLRLYFHRFPDMSDAEFVALSGIHGLGRHVSLLNMSKSCLKNLTRTCLEDAPTMLPFVNAANSIGSFNNAYFTWLLKWYNQQIEYVGQVAFIPTDVAMVVDQDLRKYVRRFAKDEQLYFRTFTSAYQKLVESTVSAPLTRGRY